MIWTLPGLHEYAVLAEKPAERPNASQGQRPRNKGPKCDRQFLSQRSHVPNILLMVERDNDGPGGKE